MPRDIKTAFLHAVRGLTILALFATVLGGCSLWSSDSKPDEQKTDALTATSPTPTNQLIENQILELKTLTRGPVIERTGDEIKVIWESEALFDFDSAMLMKDVTGTIDELSKILNRYPDTQVVITGHTDNEGSEDFNLKLSKRRAVSLKDYLVEVGVAPSRLEAFGLGARRPIAPNDTDEGRRYNRRVEIIIRPNPPPAADDN